MPIQATISPFDKAVQRVQARTPVVSKLSSAEWADVPLALRDRAFFSSRVNDLRTLQLMRTKLDDALQVKMGPKQAFTDKSKFIATMRQALGAAPGDSGSLTDITSGRRLGLIYDHNIEEANSYGRWRSQQDSTILDAYPAQRLVRIESRKEERNWEARWTAAGGKLYGGRMIALKDAGVWSTISRFGNPWPPYDFGSGMGIEDVDREEAERIGLMKPGAPAPKPSDKGFNDQLQASVSDLAPDLQEWLKSEFGDQIILEKGEAKWQGSLMKEAFDWTMANPNSNGVAVRLGKATPAAISLAAKVPGAFAKDLTGHELMIDPGHIRKIWRDHGPKEKVDGQIALTAMDFEVLPHVWRQPDVIEKGDQPGDLIFKKNLLGANYIVTWTVNGKRPQLAVKSMYKKSPPAQKPETGSRA
jgi:hypothetical protein